MKWRHSFFLIVLSLGIAITGCSSKGSFGSSSVTVTVGVWTLPHMPNQFAVIVTAPDMNPVEQDSGISASDTAIQQTIMVPNGHARSFEIQIRDSAGTVLYRGASATPVDLDGTPVTLDITLQAVIFAGTKQYGTPTKDEVLSMATDTAGNIYMLGSVFAADMSSSQVVLMKQDQFGIRQWRIQFGAAGVYNNGYGVATDAGGNVYITGFTEGVVGTDPKVNPSGTDADCFIAKYDSSGTEQWDHQFGSTGNDFCSAIAVDGNGNAYVTGSTEGSIDGTTNAGKFDAFLVKYDASGSRITAQSLMLGTAQDDHAEGIAIDSSNNIIIAGSTYGSLPGFTNPDPSGSTADVFVAKYNPSLSLLWIQQRGSADLDEAWGVAADASGNIYLAGSTYGNLDGSVNQDPTGTTSDLFVMKLNPAGTWQWTQLLGTTVNDYANGIAADANGNVYVTGGTNGSLDGNPNAGLYDMFLVKYDTNGVKTWSVQRGTASGDEGTAVATTADGSVLVAGDTGGGLDGNSNNDPTGQTDDVFLMKFDSSGQKQ